MVTCSPVAATTSSSRGSGFGASSFASASSRLVSPLIADGDDDAADGRARWKCATRRATLRIRSMLPTDVPPYFWTISAMAVGHGARPHARARAHSSRKASVALVPPKPNEFDSAARIFILRARSRHEVEVALRIAIERDWRSAARSGRATRAR